MSKVTNEQVESAAKALYEHDDAWSAAFPWPDLSDGPMSAIGYRELARAALEAVSSIHEAEPATPHGITLAVLDDMETAYSRGEVL